MCISTEFMFICIHTKHCKRSYLGLFIDLGISSAQVTLRDSKMNLSELEKYISTCYQEIWNCLDECTCMHKGCWYSKSSGIGLWWDYEKLPVFLAAALCLILFCIYFICDSLQQYDDTWRLGRGRVCKW